MSGAYHHGNLRAALVDEGYLLAREHGAEGVVLREVARRVGVSHNAAYRHFADRSVLLAEIAARAMTLLGQTMVDRVAQAPAELDEVARARWGLREIGRSYVEFAVAEPGLFGVAFAAFASPTDGPAPDPDDPGPFQVLNDQLDLLVGVGHLAPDHRPGAEVACWSSVHGFAVLHTSGPLSEVPAPERAAALEHLVTTLDVGLGALGRTGGAAPRGL